MNKDKNQCQVGLRHDCFSAKGSFKQQAHPDLTFVYGLDVNVELTCGTTAWGELGLWNCSIGIPTSFNRSGAVIRNHSGDFAPKRNLHEFTRARSLLVNII